MAIDGDIRHELTTDLIESDVAYFEAGAAIEKLPGVTIAHMAGLQSLAAGCVVQRVDTEALEREPKPFIDRIETALRDLGMHSSRIYLEHSPLNVEHALVTRGYRPSVELAIALGSDRPLPEESLSFQVVESADDWAVKRRVHEAMSRAPDGHEASTDDWVAMEKRKCEVGYMTPYLVVCDGKVVGAVNAAPWKSVLRMKNLFVQPDCRLRGIGSSIARQFGSLALQEDKAAAGAFVLADAAFVNMYTDAGYQVIAQQTEWCRKL